MMANMHDAAKAGDTGLTGDAERRPGRKRSSKHLGGTATMSIGTSANLHHVGRRR